jgi:hypothetical protein
VQVGDKAEMFFLAGDQHAVDEMNAIGVGTGCNQSWQDGIARAVFGIEPDHVALCRVTFIAGQVDVGCDGGGNEGADLALAHIR